MNGLVAAFFRADGPGATDVVGAGRERIIFSLAERVADGMNGWKIEDIETHSCDIGQTVYTVEQRTVRAGCAGEGTGKQFIPRAKARLGALDVHPQLVIVSDCPAAIRIFSHQRGKRIIEPALNGRRFIAAKHCGKTV